ncbi:MAG: hypothetical protein JSV64_06730 [Candidatus Bathyarchaeota archaeon]|nr:MAG: hypothetical protein JSV64_06730 [Candidatus Bathyarchaeota archaeon]
MHASRPCRRKLLLLSLVTMLLFSTVFTAEIFDITQLGSGSGLLSVAEASPDTTLAVEPASIVDPTMTPGSTFNVSVMVYDIVPREYGGEFVGLYAWQIHMIWDTSVLNFSSHIWELGGKTVTTPHYWIGDFMENVTSNDFKFFDYDAGYCEISESMVGSEPEDRAGVSGSGWLLTCEFIVVGVGETVIDISDEQTFLGDFYTPAIPVQGKPREEIEYVPVNGYFYNIPKRQLTVNSDPIVGVNFTVDGETHPTNWTETLDEGNYTVVMPSTWMDGSDLYIFANWDDDSTNRTRVIPLTANTTVTASYVYVPTALTLTVNSDPVSGIDFTVDGELRSTSWSSFLSEGSHTIVMPPTWIVDSSFYSFVEWEDDSTNSTRIIFLTADENITATYEYLGPVHTLTVDSDPVSGIDFTVDGVLHSTSWSGSLLEGSHTIVALPTQTVDSSFYSFVEWEDNSTNLARVVSLTADKNITAYYEEVAGTQYQLAVFSEPIINVEFTLDRATYSTMWSGSLVEGDHTITMPYRQIADQDYYFFDHWEDGSTNRTRTVSLTAHKAVIAYYITATVHQLTVNSEPIINIEFAFDGETNTTNWNYLLAEGNHTVIMPTNWTDGLAFYVFDHWEDNSTSLTRIVSLTANKTITAHYALTFIQYELTLDSVGSGTTIPSAGVYILDGGAEFPVAFVPDTGWALDRSELDSTNVGLYDPYVIAMTTNRMLVAFFSEIPEFCELTLDVVGSGTTVPSPGVYILDGGAEFPVAAIPDPALGPSWMLNRWELDSTNLGSDNPVTVTVTANRKLTAFFAAHAQLSIYSDPIVDVPFSLNGTDYATAWTDFLEVGNYTISMPSNLTVGIDLYSFVKWEDNSTNPTRMISLAANATVTAHYVYVPPVHTLSVNSDPIVGVNFTVDGVAHTSNWSGSIDEGDHTIVMSHTWTNGSGSHVFDHWEDGSTNSTRIISLIADTNVTAYYVYIPPDYYQLTIYSEPFDGVEFTLDGENHTTHWRDVIVEGNHTITWPAVWMIPDPWVGGEEDRYVLVAWGDNITETNTGTISLTGHKTLFAYYVYSPLAIYDLTVNSSPISGVNFTVDGTSNMTSWTGNFSDGAHLLTMPHIWTEGEDYYIFDRWEDVHIPATPTRIVTLAADTTVTAYYIYVPVPRTLTVNSTPFSNVDFTVDGVPYSTPWSGVLSEGDHTVVMNSTWTIGEDFYIFSKWEDASTNATRIISLTSNTNITANYTYVPPTQYQLTVNSVPSDVGFTLNGEAHSTSWSGMLDAVVPATIIVPADWTDGPDFYTFDRWEDSSTSLTRVVSLTENLTITAYYLAETIVSVEPPTNTGEVGDIFVVDVDITNAVDVYSWQVKVQWNYTILEALNVTEGPFLAGQPDGTAFVNTISDGDVNAGCTTLGDWFGVDGNGTLMSIAFNVTGVGETALDIYYASLLNYDVVQIPHITEDGYFSNIVINWYELTVDSDPIVGVEFILDGETNTTMWSGLLNEGSHTVVMPSSWMNDQDFVVFDRWEDDSTSLTRVVSLTENMTITAYYVAETIVSLEPPTNTGEIGETFVVDVNITNAVDVYSWQVKVQWDRDILEALDVTEGDFLAGQPDGTGFVYTIGEGYVDVGCTTLGDWFGVDGNGTLMSIAFNVTGVGETALDIYYAVLLNYDVDEVPHITEDGYFDNAEVIQYQLTVTSEPVINVDFTVDGEANTTIWIGILDEGSHTIVMPPIWTVGLNSYAFDHWEDASTNSTRIVPLTFNKTIIAYYVPAIVYELTVNSDPISGVDFTLNTLDYTTAWNGLLVEGDHTVVMPSTWSIGEDVYDFVEWEDASTNTTRIVSLTGNMTITASYAPTGPAGHQLTIYSYPESGVGFTVDGVANTTTWTGTLDEGNHTIIMPPVYVGATSYAFDHWEDASTNPIRVLSLTADTSIVAYYVSATLHPVMIDSDPISDVDFTFDGVNHTTTWDDTVVGGEYTVVAPAAWMDGSDLYIFLGWYDSGDALLSISVTVVITLPDDGDYFYALYDRPVV